MSNTVLEAMASALPVIVTDVGGTAELVNENGIVFPAGDVETLKRAILFLRNNLETRTAMGERSSAIAKSFSWKAVAESYLGVYTSLPISTPT